MQLIFLESLAVQRGDTCPHSEVKDDAILGVGLLSIGLKLRRTEGDRWCEKYLLCGRILLIINVLNVFLESRYNSTLESAAVECFSTFFSNVSHY